MVCGRWQAAAAYARYVQGWRRPAPTLILPAAIADARLYLEFKATDEDLVTAYPEGEYVVRALAYNGALLFGAATLT